MNKVMVNDKEVILDEKNLHFNEAILSEYLQKEGSWYNYFGAQLASAERELQDKDLKYDEIYSEKFVDYKEQGGSDKFAESKTKCDKDVINAKKEVYDVKEKVRLLQQHLRAWDKNHENAQSFGHMLRKEMDKLSSDIRFTSSTMPYDVEQKIDEIVADVESQLCE